MLKKLTIVLTMSMLLVGSMIINSCGENAPAPTEVKLPSVPPDVSNETPGGNGGPNSDLPIKSEVTRGDVIATLRLSYAMEKQLRNSNKNPAKVRAQLVRYHNKAESRTWEMLELGVVGQGDTTAVVKPFMLIKVRMKYLNRDGQQVLAYVVVTDIGTQFTNTTYSEITIGAAALKDHLLDLCSGEYESLCHFDYDSEREDFAIFAWLNSN